MHRPLDRKQLRTLARLGLAVVRFRLALTGLRDLLPTKADVDRKGVAVTDMAAKLLPLRGSPSMRCRARPKRAQSSAHSHRPGRGESNGPGLSMRREDPLRATCE